LDDWSEYHSDLPEPLLDLIERVLLATAGDVDAMVTFHRRRLMHRVPVTFETRLAVTLTVARTRYEDQAELTALFGPLIRSGGMQALRDVFDAINRERETLSWSPLDHNVRGGHLLSLAADELGVEPVWQFIERGGIGKASLMNHVDMATEEPSDLAVRILESAPAEVRHSAADAFIEHRGASYGRLSDAYARDRDRASRWSATSSSPQVRDWAQEVAAAIDASLPFYRQRDEEFG
jgi:hypothetical protein